MELIVHLARLICYMQASLCNLNLIFAEHTSLDAFGRFLDDAVNIPLDKKSCEFVDSLIKAMSQSFRNTQTKTATRSKLRSLASCEGSNRGHETSRASVFRHLLLKYLKSLFPTLDLDTLEPAQSDKVIKQLWRHVISHIYTKQCGLTIVIFFSLQSQCLNDGCYRILDSQGTTLFHILIIEVKEDTGIGGGNASMEIGAHFGRVILQHLDKPWVKNTCCPAFGLELLGDAFR